MSTPRATAAPARKPFPEDQSWALKNLTGADGIRYAITVADDGMLRGRTPDLPRADAERVAAALSGLQSLSRVTAGVFSDDEGLKLQQTLVETTVGSIFTTPAGQNTTLAVWAGPDAEIGRVARAMQVLVGKLGERALNSPERQPPTGGAAE